MANKYRIKTPFSVRLKHFIQRMWGVLAILTMTAILYAKPKANILQVGVICAVSYVLAVYLTGVTFRVFAFRTVSPAEEGEMPFLNALDPDLIKRLFMPVVICDNDGQILWHNNAFAQLFRSGEILLGRNLSQYCTAELSDILSEPSAEGHPASLLSPLRKEAEDAETFPSPADYRIQAYSVPDPLKNGGESHILFWNDKRDFSDLLLLMEKRDTVVGYIFIDNLDELLQYVQEQYRLASARVQGVLAAWVAGMNGILKEYERNKFLVVFEARYLPTLKENRFSVMDSVRDIRVGESSMPVTISMGLAHLSPEAPISLAEKENAAREALDLALQRGGDQVVFKTDKDTEFFGGKTKSMEKRTRVRSRVNAGKLAALITEASNVIIMGHRFADHDSVGSCIGICQFARYCGVPANIVFDFSDQNVRICLERLIDDSDYDGTFVDAASAMDLIRSETLLIICDVSNPANFEAPELYENIKNTVIIDHHRKTGEFSYPPALTYIDPSASSASELVAEMLELTLPLGTLPAEEANLMLAGILLDTNQFTRNTGIRTFSAAVYLRREGASPGDAKMLFRISLDDYKRESRFGSDVYIYREQIAIALCDGDGDSSDDRIAAAKAADKLLSVKGVSASFALVRIGTTVNISARSLGTMNVQLILEKLHGGGHFDVAGAQIPDCTVPAALEQLKTAIDLYLAEINTVSLGTA